MSITFPKASEAKDYSFLKAIHIDVCAIQTGILDGMENGVRMATVCGTPVGLSPYHYQAWQSAGTTNQYGCVVLDGVLINGQPATDYLNIQDAIMKCFTDLGYSIKRVQNPSNANSFCWEVVW